MSRKRFDDMCCSIARALNEIGDWWSLLIVREAMYGRRRFSDFERQLGISKNILRDRLAHLVAHGVLTKVDVGEYGNHFEYALTDKGRDLFVVLTAIRQWGDKWIYGEGNEPVVICDRRHRQPLPVLEVTDIEGRKVSLTDVYASTPDATE